MSEQNANTPQPNLAEERLGHMNELLRNDPAFGMHVTVQRSSGAVEDDWQITRIVGSQDDPLITTSRQIGGSIKDKTFPLGEFLSMQRLSANNASPQPGAVEEQQLFVKGSPLTNWKVAGLNWGKDRGEQEDHLFVILEAPYGGTRKYIYQARLGDLIRWQQEARDTYQAAQGHAQVPAEAAPQPALNPSAAARLGEVAHKAAQAAPVPPSNTPQQPMTPAAIPQQRAAQPAAAPASMSEQASNALYQSAGDPEKVVAEANSLLAQGAASEVLKQLPDVAGAIGGKVYDLLNNTMIAGGERYLRDPDMLAAFIRSHATFMLDGTVRDILKDYGIRYKIDDATGNIAIADPNRPGSFLVYPR